MTERRATFADRFSALAHSRWLIPALFVAEVLETTIIPYPYEAIFIALCLTARDRIWLFVLITAAGSAVAGAIMYHVGAIYAEPISARLGMEAALAEYTSKFADRGLSFIFLGATTAAPSVLINMAAGASGFPFALFLCVFTGARLLRFAVLGLVLYLCGERVVRAWRAAPAWAKRTLALVVASALIWWFTTGFL